MTMIATITTCPNAIALTAVSAAGWRKISKMGRVAPVSEVCRVRILHGNFLTQVARVRTKPRKDDDG